MDSITYLKSLIASLKAKLVYKPKGMLPLVKRRLDLVVKDMTDLGYQVTVFQGYRSFEEQDALYAQGRTKPGAIVTNAKGGDSFHNWGVAADVVFVVNGRPSWANSHPWSTLGKVGKKHGFEWGGDWVGFVDRPHLQMPLTFTLEDFKKGKINYKLYV